MSRPNLARRLRWRIRTRVREWLIAARAPWPIVWECHVHNDDSTCPQCDGSHEHRWIAWEGGREHFGGSGVPVRCRSCGARKCDHPTCVSRRHHRDPHIYDDGRVLVVGR